MRTKALATVALGIAAAGVLLCESPDLPSRACTRVHHLLVWGWNRPAPLPECAAASVPLGGSGPIVARGSITWENGHSGSRAADGLPLRRLDLAVGGLLICIEDARHCSIPACRAAARGGGAALVASIWGCFDAGDPEVLDRRLYRFEPGGAIELELPFSVTVTPPPCREEAGGFSVTVGELSAQGRQQWDETDCLWEPILSADRRALVRVEMVHWREATRYAVVSLEGPAGPPEILPRCSDRGQWRLACPEGAIVCEGLVTGHIARDRSRAATRSPVARAAACAARGGELPGF